MSIATFTPLLHLPDQRRIQAQTPPVVPATTLAALEFALLEAWLASTPALKLPLHQIESQQQTKGREVQRLLLQLICSSAATEMWDLRCASNKRPARSYIPIVGSAPVP